MTKVTFSGLNVTILSIIAMEIITSLKIELCKNS